MVGTPLLQPAPSPSADTCVHAVTRPAVAESAFVSLDLTFGPRGQGGLEGTVVEMVHSIGQEGSEKTAVVAAVDQVKDLKPSFTGWCLTLSRALLQGSSMKFLMVSNVLLIE